MRLGSTAGRHARSVRPRASADQARADLVRTLAEGTRERLSSVLKEARSYIPRINTEAKRAEEVFMSKPDLESLRSEVLFEGGSGVQVRRVSPYYIVEVDMEASGRQWGDLVADPSASGRAFNRLADYLFGNNVPQDGSNEPGESMEMTTPVISSTEGEAMEMTTPVISSGEDSGRARMQFLLPAEGREGKAYPEPKPGSGLCVRKVDERTVAVRAFPGLARPELVEQQKRVLLNAVAEDSRMRVSPSANAELAQYNPPFTPGFMRTNEVFVDVELLNSPSASP